MFQNEQVSNMRQRKKYGYFEKKFNYSILIFSNIKKYFKNYSYYAKRLRIDYSIFASSNKRGKEFEIFIHGHVAQW